MAIRIEIKNDNLTPRQITPKQGPNVGKIMTFHEQEAWVLLPDQQGQPRPYPQRIVLNIDADKGQKAYPAGVYTLSDSSFFVNRFGSLELGRPALVGVNPGARAA